MISLLYVGCFIPSYTIHNWSLTYK